MAGSDAPFRIDDTSGGQNSAESPLSILRNQVASALNWEWFRAKFGRKRRGSRLVERTSGASSLPSNKTFSTLTLNRQDDGFVTGIEASDFTAWYTFSSGVGTFGTFTPLDTQASSACWVNFNNKFFIAYKSSVDRLHVQDRRVGIAPPTSNPTVALSAGAVTDTRRYRSVLLYSPVSARSEPSGETLTGLAAQRATLTFAGGPAGDTYDLWQLQVASIADNYATWWVVGQAATAATIVDNNASIIGLDPAPELGLFVPPHSAKYITVDDNRLLLAGAHEAATTSPLQQRVWFTPVLGDRDEADDERIPDTVSQSNWVDLDAGDGGGGIAGFGPSTLGDVLVFKRSQIWRLVRTGVLDAPYLPRPIDKSYGTFGYRTICAGQDATGAPCVYFASSRGPARVGRDGPEYLGTSIEDIWSTVNQFGNAYTSQHAVYYTDRGQYWLWVSVNGATVPSVLLIYSVATGAWAQYTGPLATARCSQLWARFIQEPSKGVGTEYITAPSVPYCAPNTNGQIAECDAINPQTGAALDTDLETWTSGSTWADGTTYSARITTGAIQPKELDGWVSVSGGTIAADAATGVSVSVALIPDFDTSRIRAASTTLTPSGSSAVVVNTLDDCQMSDARHIQVRIGDAAATASQWVIRAVQIRVKGAADR